MLGCVVALFSLVTTTCCFCVGFVACFGFWCLAIALCCLLFCLNEALVVADCGFVYCVGFCMVAYCCLLRVCW